MEETPINSQPPLEDQIKDDKRYKFSKREIGLVVIIVLAITGVTVFAWQTDKSKKAEINSFASCVAAGNPVMESYPEQCAANGQTWSNPDQTTSESTINTNKSGFDMDSEHIIKIEDELGLALISATDIDKLPDATPQSFKSYIQHKLTNSTVDEFGCKSLYRVHSVSAVNISGGVNSVNANAENSNSCGGGAAIFWYIKNGTWNEVGTQDAFGCAELQEIPIYAEFIPQCLTSDGTQANNPNGSIDNIL